MKNIILISSMFFLFLFFTSCEDQLELNNPNHLSESTFWKTDDDFLKGLAATYKTLRSLGPYSLTGVYVSNVRGDDAVPYEGMYDLVALSSFLNTPTTSYPAMYYSNLYQCIFRSNQVISYAQSADISDDSKLQYIAEAKFLRALFYFELAKNFGAVPIITELFESTSDYYYAQSSQDLVYEQIIRDLTDAKRDLPLTYPAEWAGRVTKGAAIGMLGKVYIYTKNWSAAEAEFSLLSDTEGKPNNPYTYDLLPNFEDNFLKEFDNNVESLFEVQNVMVGGSRPIGIGGMEGSEAQTQSYAQFFAPPEVGGWPIVESTQKLLDAFLEEKTATDTIDPRAFATLAWNYTGNVYYQVPFQYLMSEALYGAAYLKKYQNYQYPSEVGQNSNSEINDKVLRFADILLLYGEALTMQNKVAEAYPMVNRIRTRAALATLPLGYNQEQMMAEIRHQRMLEFVKEGQRFYDLVRWGIVEDEMATSGKLGVEYYIPGKSDYLPIPQDEINNNPNIDQNPLWK